MGEQADARRIFCRSDERSARLISANCCLSCHSMTVSEAARTRSFLAVRCLRHLAKPPARRCWDLRRASDAAHETSSVR